MPKLLRPCNTYLCFFDSHKRVKRRDIPIVSRELASSCSLPVVPHLKVTIQASIALQIARVVLGIAMYHSHLGAFTVYVSPFRDG